VFRLDDEQEVHGTRESLPLYSVGEESRPSLQRSSVGL
jgi:hypothetical protein